MILNYIFLINAYVTMFNKKGLLFTSCTNKSDMFDSTDIKNLSKLIFILKLFKT